jgi:methionine sulfoxide reductase heme-binding subunit
MALQLSNKQVGWVKAAIFVLALLPFARLVWGTATGAFTDPLAEITKISGEWALYFLCITLAVTPLRRLTGWNWLVKLRRMVGLFTFFYAFVHFIAFLWFDHFFDVAAMLADVVKRPFILVGFIAFVLLIPLAATSTNAMIKRLGGKRWQWLHRLIYVIGPLAILHYWWMKEGKSDFAQPILFGAIVAALLGLRVFWHFRRKPQAVRA